VNAVFIGKTFPLCIDTIIWVYNIVYHNPILLFIICIFKVYQATCFGSCNELVLGGDTYTCMLTTRSLSRLALGVDIHEKLYAKITRSRIT
jgi:hypothetical protein